MSAILIVDESSAVHADLGDALEATGLRVLRCAALSEARTALRMQPIALAILAPTLPDGDGLEFLELVRRDQVLGAVPVLMLASWDELAERAVELGVEPADCVGKPYDLARVLERVRGWLGPPPVRELVLVIAGDAALRGALGAALGRAGLAIAEAASGDAGLHLAATTRPTAIALAAALPDMDGPSVVRRLRLEPALRTTPCVVLSDRGARDSEVRSLDAGADAFVQAGDMELIVARLRALIRTARAAAPLASPFAPKRVLTVDDDPIYLEVLADRLRSRGYDVVPARSGEAALHLLETQAVDCVLLDRTMSGMGGVATCRRLKQAPATRDVPLIFLTATEERDAVIEGLGAGADDFVSKASGFDVLSARVQAQLRRKQLEDEQRKVRERLLRSELEIAEARAARELAEARGQLAAELTRANAELAQSNAELEAFSYSVSHYLRAPLRTIGAFAQALAEELGETASARAQAHLHAVLAAAARMAELIDALLELARVRRAPISRRRVDLSAIAAAVRDELAHREPGRAVQIDIAPNLVAEADDRLARILIDNLLGSAWRITAHQSAAKIELGAEGDAFYVRDNGPGFDLARPGRLFTPFCPVHADGGPADTGVGLATARRIVERHGGQIWAEGAPGAGTKISFTLPAPELAPAGRAGA